MVDKGDLNIFGQERERDVPKKLFGPSAEIDRFGPAGDHFLLYLFVTDIRDLRKKA
jgi:hypothetical protein